MEFNLFQMDYVISLEERKEIIEKLSELGKWHPHCSACESEVDIGFMRKLPDADINTAMCLPCFLNNHCRVDSDDIDKIVGVAQRKGWYHD